MELFWLFLRYLVGVILFFNIFIYLVLFLFIVFNILGFMGIYILEKVKKFDNLKLLKSFDIE